MTTQRETAQRIVQALLASNLPWPWRTPKQLRKDVAWIHKRYDELRLTHPEGFCGARKQSAIEFVERVLSGEL